MEYIKTFIDIFIHLDKHLSVIIQNYGAWTYGILFLIIFCETGLVVTPFLPGDSLLFAAGAFAGLGALEPVKLCVLLSVAAILGDTLNYSIGHFLGPKIFTGEKIRFLNRDHLEKTHQFYEKYGGKTIIIARFMPIIRTFAPFVAGIGSMTYSRFILFNVAGGLIWIVLFVGAGYMFGNVPMVKRNFTLVIIAIIIISIMPGVIEYVRHRKAARAA